MTLQEKEEKFEQILKNMKSVSIAFSGGVDSTFLLYKAKQVLNDRVESFTIKTPYIPSWEVEEAKELAQKIIVKHKVISL